MHEAHHGGLRFEEHIVSSDVINNNGTSTGLVLVRVRRVASGAEELILLAPAKLLTYTQLGLTSNTK